MIILQYRGYQARIETDPDTHHLFGRVLGIRAVITFAATHSDELLPRFQAVIDTYRAWCRERGKQPETPLLSAS